jgi:hypothetical protein
MRKNVKIIRSSDERLVDAGISNLSTKNLDDFELIWKPQLQNSVAEDRVWDWVKKERIYVASPNYESYAVECDGMTQGLMLIDTRFHRSQIESSRRLVYVSFLATAPWNRSLIQTPPTYRAVGSILLQFARERSFELGYGGLVGLHALSESVSFYAKIGMIGGEADPDRDGLPCLDSLNPRQSRGARIAILSGIVARSESWITKRSILLL